MYNLIRTKFAIVIALLIMLLISGCFTPGYFHSSTTVINTGGVPGNFVDSYPLPYVGYPTGYYSNTTYSAGGYCCHHYPFYNGLIVPRYYYNW